MPLPADEDSVSDVAASAPDSDGSDTLDASGSNDVAAAAEVAQEDEDDSFDLAAELRETIEEEDSRAAEEDSASSSSEATSEEEGFASIFKDFKSGVEKTLAEDDYDTRFDLGIAYRGMELYDDAIGEFQICLGSPGHQVESLYMMGLCAIDLGRFLDASNHFEQALARDDLTPQKEAGLRFDLARSLESQGDLTRALEALEAAQAADPTIPGIDDYKTKLTELVASTSGPVELADTESSDEGFENFDDLVAEIEAEDAEEETFESFDDVIAEAEASQIAAENANSTSATEAPAQAETVEAIEVEEDPDPDASGSKTGKRKKKKKKRISFV